MFENQLLDNFLLTKENGFHCCKAFNRLDSLTDPNSVERKVEIQRAKKGMAVIQDDFKAKLFEEAGVEFEKMLDVCIPIEDFCSTVDFNALEHPWPCPGEDDPVVVIYFNYPFGDYSKWYKKIHEEYQRGCNIVVLGMKNTLNGATWRKYFKEESEVIFSEPFKYTFKGYKQPLREEL